MLISKSAAAIIALIILDLLYGLYATISHSWSALIFSVVGLGGMLVFLGLWMERESEKASEKLHVLRVVKLKSEIGWWLLMLGIAFEVFAAIVTAIWENWEFEQSRINEAKNAALNHRISRVSATVDLWTQGTNFDVSNGVTFAMTGTTNNLQVTVPKSLELAFGRSEEVKHGLPSLLTEDGVQSGIGEATSQWSLKFPEDNSISSLTNEVVSNAYDWNAFEIFLPCLGRDSEVIGGTITLHVNDEIIPIKIPPQMVKHSRGEYQNATNNSGKSVTVFDLPVPNR